MTKTMTLKTAQDSVDVSLDHNDWQNIGKYLGDAMAAAALQLYRAQKLPKYTLSQIYLSLQQEAAQQAERLIASNE